MGDDSTVIYKTEYLSIYSALIYNKFESHIRTYDMFTNLTKHFDGTDYISTDYRSKSISIDLESVNVSPNYNIITFYAN